MDGRAAAAWLFFPRYALGRVHRLVVASAEGVPADDGDLLKHFEAVFEVAHAGALVVGPADRHLDNPEIALEGDEQYLRVEAPALNGLKLEDGLGGLAGEGLEAALGVGVGQAYDEAGDGVEAAAKELAVEGVGLGIGRAHV